MTIVNIDNLSKIENDLSRLREYIVQVGDQNKGLNIAGARVTVTPSNQQMTDANARCNALLTTIKADVLALETI